MVLEAFGPSTDRDACLPSRESPMSERTRDIARGAGVVALVAFVSACSDRSVPSGPGVTPAVAGHVLTCQADLPARTVIVLRRPRRAPPLARRGSRRTSCSAARGRTWDCARAV